MRVAIVSTSINPRPATYADWADAGHLIVAGDLNSPPELHGYVEGLGGSYLDANAQKRFGWSDDVGWRCIQRRNAAIALALDAKFDYIVTVDDDNTPLPNAAKFVSGHIDVLTSHLPHLSKMFVSGSGFLNTGEFCIPPFHQRGVPYGVDTRPHLAYEVIGDQVLPGAAPRVVVSQAQVLGDPDCDAVERIANAPDVKAVATEAVILPGVYAAFNTQATVWARDWAPVMACLPGVGRYDDIFASMIFARLARLHNVALHVGTPVVRQDRNWHNLANDLRQELYGMNHVFRFRQVLDDAHITTDMPLWFAYAELIVAASHFLPDTTVRFAQRWADDWKERL